MASEKNIQKNSFSQEYFARGIYRFLKKNAAVSAAPSKEQQGRCSPLGPAPLLSGRATELAAGIKKDFA
jgi:hypothetical protein